jgi:protocatechuate 3,4-dioxygenase beta subunit
MMHRRGFLYMAAVGGCLRGASAKDAFDDLPPQAWKNARRNGLIMIHRPEPRAMAAEAWIAGSNEPGEPITVAGRVFAPDGRTPAAGITVYAYNTDAQGYYGENQTDYPPRVYGWMRSDAAGRFTLHTIRPGNYPNMTVPAHIHFSAWGAGYPPQWTEELRFAGDRYLTGEMLREDAELGEFHTIRRLVDGRCEFRFKLQRETNFH